MRTVIIVLILTLSGTSTLAGDQVYQWTDENGVVHYSNQPPPPGAQATEKSLKPMPAVGTVPPHVATTESRPDEELTPEQRGQRNREDLARKRILATSYSEALQVECEQARSVIGKLSPASGPIRVADAQGNVRVMNDEERQNRITLAQEFIRNNCN